MTLFHTLRMKAGTALIGAVLLVSMATSMVGALERDGGVVSAAAVVHRGSDARGSDAPPKRAAARGVESVRRGAAARGVEASVRHGAAQQSPRKVKSVGTGEASFYGRRFAGRPTANGEAFDPTALTAAHRSLPFGSKVRITNTSNGRSVVVRVNDRGPYAEGRLIDVSRAAAERLGMVQSGTAEVNIELIS